MSFDWWHPEYTTTCVIIATIVEIHRLILDLCVSKILNQNKNILYLSHI